MKKIIKCQICKKPKTLEELGEYPPYQGICKNCLKILLIPNKSQKLKPVKFKCSVRGCKEGTNSFIHTKPYCSEHYIIQKTKKEVTLKNGK